MNKTLLDDFGDLLSTKDLAKLFGVSKQTIYKELKAGKFGVPIQVGRVFLVPKIHVIQRFFSPRSVV